MREKKLIIDGHKPIEIMTKQEKDNYFMKQFGKTYKDFCDETDEMSEEKIKQDTADILNKLIIK